MLYGVYANEDWKFQTSSCETAVQPLTQYFGT